MSVTVEVFICPHCRGLLTDGEVGFCPYCTAVIDEPRHTPKSTGRHRAKVKSVAWRERRRRKRQRYRRNVAARRQEKRAVDLLFASYVDDHPGHPLGRGMPSGRTLRIDFLDPQTGSWRGESHREAWMRIVRLDPCAYCGAEAGTVDHIVPKSRPVIGLGGAHSWLNYTAACTRCNGSKADRPMLLWMTTRR